MNNFSKSIMSWFSKARAVSKLADSSIRNIRIGCIVVYSHSIISTGFNIDKTSPLQKKYNKYRFSDDNTRHMIHAEVMALSNLVGNKEIDFSRVKLFTYRELADGSLGKSRPCKSCMALIKDLGIRDIYYTSDDGYCHEKLY